MDRLDRTSAQPAAPRRLPCRRRQRKKARQRQIIEWVLLIAAALGIALVIKTFLFQAFYIPSPSMVPTLKVGDRVLVNKLSYDFHDVHRGDIVVFKFPQDNTTDYIKRLIGLPGDRVQMKDGVLYINDKPVPKVKVDDYIEDVGGQPHHVPRYRETLPNGISYAVLDREPEGNLDNTQVFTVPEGRYFMMGDNRDNSADSRIEGGIGQIPFSYIKGRASLIWISFGGEHVIRFERFFRGVK